MCEQTGYDYLIYMWDDRQSKNFDNLKSTNTQIDLKSLNYLSPLKSLDYISCPICKLPFIEPWSTICGHTFCKNCIFESLKSVLGERCPLDRVNLKLSKKLRNELKLNNNNEYENDNNENYNVNENLDDIENECDIYPAPIIISNMTDDLEISCLNRDRGCEWTGERWSIKKHLQDNCEYTRVLCSCGELCERRILVEFGMLTKLPSGAFSVISTQCHTDRNITLTDESYAYGGNFNDLDETADSNSIIDNNNSDNNKHEVHDDHHIGTNHSTEESIIKKSSKLCPHTLIECSECGTSIRLMDTQNHLEHECLKNMTICNGCHLSFPLMHLENHQRHCQLIYVDCPGEKYGCTWKGQREILKKIHQNECVFIKMSNYLDKMESSIKNLNRENDSLRLQMNSMLNSVVNGKVHNLGYPLELEEIGSTNGWEQLSTHNHIQNINTNIEIDNDNVINDNVINNNASLTIPVTSTSTSSTSSSSSSSSRHRISMSKVKILIRELEINKEISKTLVEDNVNLREQLNSQRAMILGLQQQMQFMMIERRRMFVSKAGSSKNHAATKL